MGFTQTIKNIWSVEDLRKRIGITLLLVIIYRSEEHTSELQSPY